MFKTLCTTPTLSLRCKILLLALREQSCNFIDTLQHLTTFWKQAQEIWLHSPDCFLPEGTHGWTCNYCIVLSKCSWVLTAQASKIEGGRLHEGGSTIPMQVPTPDPYHCLAYTYFQSLSPVAPALINIILLLRISCENGPTCSLVVKHSPLAVCEIHAVRKWKTLRMRLLTRVCETLMLCLRIIAAMYVMSWSLKHIRSAYSSHVAMYVSSTTICTNWSTVTVQDFHMVGDYTKDLAKLQNYQSQ